MALFKALSCCATERCGRGPPRTCSARARWCGATRSCAERSSANMAHRHQIAGNRGGGRSPDAGLRGTAETDDAGTDAAPLSRNATMSCLVMRPPKPAPVTWADRHCARERFCEPAERSGDGRLRSWVSGRCFLFDTGPMLRWKAGAGVRTGRPLFSQERRPRVWQPAVAIGGDRADDGVDLNRCAFRDLDFLENSRRRREGFRRPPCRLKSRTAVRRAVLCHRAFSAIW